MIINIDEAYISVSWLFQYLLDLRILPGVGPNVCRAWVHPLVGAMWVLGSAALAAGPDPVCMTIHAHTAYTIMCVFY